MSDFKQGAPTLYLKRMGRTPTELWYDAVDMIGKSVLVISGRTAIPTGMRASIFPYCSTARPRKPLAHRQARNRDGRADSPLPPWCWSWNSRCSRRRLTRPN